ncbi:uncharacterized protein BBA_00445 [Beauveria bassiana ARSEF 2860]|uniref:Uncharacterized protein n=1 Tax=Beauveria bassiana (strain ARSEF 2860) TaxID=655819 RepID=J4WMA1_BEAB2|nr:uncharacterized protein BBA_00445 [Beauveria bassiana ARSEF 2860]EJP70815.1 hypothetical protein BBA_00445 [Beauveria bassiana ARSEF 2860]
MGLLSSLKSKARIRKSESDCNSESSGDDKEIDGFQKSTASSSSFLATSSLDIHAIGYDTNQALTGKTLENISVHRAESGQTEYLSIRPKKTSNSCALVRASDQDRALISTIYRIGPGRHPKMHILPANARVTVDAALHDKAAIPGEEVEVKSRSFASRAQVFDTALGKFQWRYGSREEKRACDNADSLLVMEGADGARVAQLVRNADLRTAGTLRYSGGNGGRLMIDLHEWENSDKACADGVEAFAVASCILMLKREADRFINNTVAAVV